MEVLKFAPDTTALHAGEHDVSGLMVHEGTAGATNELKHESRTSDTFLPNSSSVAKHIVMKMSLQQLSSPAPVKGYVSKYLEYDPIFVISPL